MREALAVAVLALGLCGCAALPRAWAGDALDELQRRIIRVNERVTPSVVHIEAALKQNDRRTLVTGSGLITDAGGIVLTNEHVVERAQKISVIVPGRTGRYPASVVGTDKQTDLAVLRLEPRKGEPPFAAARLGDSERLEVGEWVIAIGNPYGLEGTVSLGIVSAKKRDLNAEQLLNDFIQTDAMIDQGSSGGPLVNLSGEVVGINSRGQGRGIGFTIPINTAKLVVKDLLDQGRIARGYLGITIQPLDRDLAHYWRLDAVQGVVINGVSEGSPAARAGLKAGDILTRYDGAPVAAEKEEDLGDLQRRIALTPVGHEVALDLVRGGEPLALRAKLDVQPKVVPDEQETDFGFSVQEVTENLFRAHRLAGREGVLVSFVERGSEAAEAGMQPGDLIQSVAEHPVADIEGFREAMGSLPAREPFLLQAHRGDVIRYLLITPRGGANGGPAARGGGAD